MVNMGVGQADGIDVHGGDGQVAVFIDIRALFHAAVNEDVFAAGRQQGGGTGDLMGRSQEGYFHTITLLFATFSL